MIRAALREIQTTPLASFGALAGILSFAVVLMTTHVSSGTPATPIGSANAALAFVKLALVVPGTAFFFSFLGHLFLIGGTIRGAFVTALLFLISEALSAAITGVILSPFPHPAPVAPSVEHYVLGLNFAAIAFMLYLTNLLVFAGVIGESIFAPEKSLPDPNGGQTDNEDDEEEESDDEDAYTFLLVLGLFTFVGGSLLSAFVGLAVFKASLGAFFLSASASAQLLK